MLLLSDTVDTVDAVDLIASIIGNSVGVTAIQPIVSLLTMLLSIDVVDNTVDTDYAVDAASIV
jgi:hypothetical protein